MRANPTPFRSPRSTRTVRPVRIAVTCGKKNVPRYAFSFAPIRANRNRDEKGGLLIRKEFAQCPKPACPSIITGRLTLPAEPIKERTMPKQKYLCIQRSQPGDGPREKPSPAQMEAMY